MFWRTTRRNEAVQEALVETLRDSLRIIQSTNERILEELGRISEAIVEASKKKEPEIVWQPLPKSEEREEIEWLRESGQIDDGEMQRLLREAGLLSTEIHFEPSSYPRLSEVLDNQED